MKNITNLWNRTFGKRKLEHEELMRKVELGDRFDKAKLEVLRQEGEQSVSFNMNLNGADCVCTEKCKDGVLISRLYEFQRPLLTAEEMNKEFQGKATFVGEW